MAKIVTILLLLLLLPVVIYLLVLFVPYLNPNYDPYPVYITDNIEDYNTENYPLGDFDVFLEQIPSEATVVSYHYSAIYNSTYDICLQLKFNTAEEIDSYLSKIKDNFYEKHIDDPVVKDNGWAVSEPNPYNSGYTDLFLVTRSPFASSRMTEYAGYSYTRQSDVFNSITDKFYGYYQLISYSYEDLTVFSFFSDQKLYYHEDDEQNGIFGSYIPQDFIHFNVPLDVETERWHYFNYGY